MYKPPPLHIFDTFPKGKLYFSVVIFRELVVHENEG